MVYTAVFVICLVLGVPIAFTLGLTALVFVPAFGSTLLTGVPQRMFVGVNKFVLMAIPFFILAGLLMNQAGISRRLIRFSQNVVGWVPGGLAMTNVLASMIFAGNSGSAQADVAALGSILIPAMKTELVNARGGLQDIPVLLKKIDTKTLARNLEGGSNPVNSCSDNRDFHGLS